MSRRKTYFFETETRHPNNPPFVFERPYSEQWMSAAQAISPPQLAPGLISLHNSFSSVSDEQDESVDPPDATADSDTLERPRLSSTTDIVGSVLPVVNAETFEYFQTRIWSEHFATEHDTTRTNRPQSLRFLQKTVDISDASRSRNSSESVVSTLRQTPQVSLATRPTVLMKFFDRASLTHQTSSSSTIFEYIGDLFKSLPTSSTPQDSGYQKKFTVPQPTLPSKPLGENIEHPSVVRPYVPSEPISLRVSAVMKQSHSATPPQQQSQNQRPPIRRSVRRQRISFYNRTVRSNYYFLDENDVGRHESSSEVGSRTEVESITTGTDDVIDRSLMDENVVELEYPCENNAGSTDDHDLDFAPNSPREWKSFFEWRDGIELGDQDEFEATDLTNLEPEESDVDISDGLSLFAMRPDEFEDVDSVVDDDSMADSDGPEASLPIDKREPGSPVPLISAFDIESILVSMLEESTIHLKSSKSAPSLAQPSPAHSTGYLYSVRNRSFSEPIRASAIWQGVPLVFFRNGVHFSIVGSEFVHQTTPFPEIFTHLGLRKDFVAYSIMLKLLRPEIESYENPRPCSLQITRRYSEFKGLFQDLVSRQIHRRFSHVSALIDPTFQEPNIKLARIPAAKFLRALQQGYHFSKDICLFSTSEFHSTASSYFQFGSRLKVSWYCGIRRERNHTFFSIFYPSIILQSSIVFESCLSFIA
ncbi:hypothetical protein BC830DRAFT_445534 [Chytriomyces sp. MP71]|nr:hypothetical protein BC830DRAFT_445534 [Chytriomyces sp. MP71]